MSENQDAKPTWPLYIICYVVLAILAVAFVLGPALLIPRLHELFGELQAGAYVLIIAGFAASLILTFILLVGIWRSRQ